MNAENTTHLWHDESLQGVFERLGANEKGLSTIEAQERATRYGPNRLPEAPPPSKFRILVRQFASPLIYVLILAAAVAIAIGDFEDAGFIAAVLVVNAMIGGFQEHKAEKSSQALRKLLEVRAAVLRDGETRDILADSIVPGDVLWLESGKRVPADLRLISDHGLEVDESLLTGESIPVMKRSDQIVPEEATIGDRANQCFAGSIVTRGRGTGVVVATGGSTLVGQLALDIHDRSGGRPPLLERMERFTRVLAIVTLAIAVLIGGVGAAS